MITSPDWANYPETQVVDNPDQVGPGWVVLATWVERSDVSNSTYNQDQNGNQIVNSAHSTAKFLMGRTTDTAIKDALDAKKVAEHDVEEAAKHRKAALDELIHTQKERNDARDLAERHDKRLVERMEELTQERDTRRKMETDLGKLRKEIGDGRVREILEK